MSSVSAGHYVLGSEGLAGLAEEPFRSAWVGIPNALVWELVSRG